jgi:hypothetical protein
VFSVHLLVWKKALHRAIYRQQHPVHFQIQRRAFFRRGVQLADYFEAVTKKLTMDFHSITSRSAGSVKHP